MRRIDELESRLQALVPEPSRGERMLREASVSAVLDRPLSESVVGIKDVIRLEGLPTGAGSAVPPEVFAGPEASCVTALREAGAVFLGKTVTAEFASSAPGPTRNPRNLAHTPGGSSSGSAAAVAAGYCQFAIGTQTIGSVIRPAAFCGIVGFKPTYGRIPIDGVVMNAPSFDTLGILAASVSWSALASSVLCTGWVPALADIRQPVIAVPEGPYLQQAGEEARAAFEAQVAVLEKAGYSVRRVPVMPDIEEINRRHRVINRVQFARQHADWFPRYGDRYRPATVETILAGQQVPEAEYAAACDRHPSLRSELCAAMAAEGIDLWACPAATGPAPRGIESTGDPIMNLPWTHAGMPALTLPAGQAANGLPLGLQLVAAPQADEYLLAWGAAMEPVLRPAPAMADS
ncbi:MAG: amidase [Candidatus Dormibacteraeota bacterium]|nr:amidase [Candidatus Dormibacteraeota bacterium]